MKLLATVQQLIQYLRTNNNLDKVFILDELDEGQPILKYARPFGKKEKVLNYTNQTYHLTGPPKVGEVMALIRECLLPHLNNNHCHIIIFIRVKEFIHMQLTKYEQQISNNRHRIIIYRT